MAIYNVSVQLNFMHGFDLQTIRLKERLYKNLQTLFDIPVLVSIFTLFCLSLDADISEINADINMFGQLLFIQMLSQTTTRHICIFPKNYCN